MTILPNQKLSAKKRNIRLSPKLLLTALGFLGLIIVGLTVINIFFGRPTLRIQVDPSDSTILLNDQLFTQNTHLEPGRAYQIIVAAPGYIPQKLAVTARRFQPIRRSIILAPAPKPKVAAQNVSAVFVSHQNNETLLIDSTGKKFYRLKLLPTNQYDLTAISNDIIPELQEPPILSPEFTLAMFRRSDGTTGLFDFKFYDLTSQEYHDWGPDIGDITWRSDGQRLVYVFDPPGGERSLIKIDRDRDNLERIFDLKPEGIINPSLDWSGDQEVIALVDRGNLYLLDPLTSVLTKVITGGVTLVKLSPTSRQLAYTQNGQLKLLNFELVDRFSTNPQSQKNIGRIILNNQPIETGLLTKADQGVYSKDGNRFYAIADNHVWEIFTSSGAIHQVTSNEAGQIGDIDVSNDGNHLYVIIGTTLYDWYIQ